MKICFLFKISACLLDVKFSWVKLPVSIFKIARTYVNLKDINFLEKKNNRKELEISLPIQFEEAKDIFFDRSHEISIFNLQEQFLLVGFFIKSYFFLSKVFGFFSILKKNKSSYDINSGNTFYHFYYVNERSGN